MSDILKNGSVRATETAFRPVRATESKLENASPVDGFIYFTTDSKKIYLGTEDKYLPMGGNSGIYYGKRVPAEGESESEVTMFNFKLPNDIDGENVPNVDDLILNEPDGCFYSVKVVNEANGFLVGEKLTVAGSGGSGGGGGGTGFVKPTITGLDANEKYISIHDVDDISIKFIANSLTATNNFVDIVELYFNNNTSAIIMDVESDFGKEIAIDLKKYKDYLNLTGTGSNTISVIVQDAYGTRSSKVPFTFFILDLRLSSEQDAIIAVKEAEGTVLDYSFRPVGGSVTGNIARFAEITIAPIENPSEILSTTQAPISSLDTNLYAKIDLKNLTHGVYILKTTYYVLVEDTNTLIGSNTLTHQILYIKADNEEPLIASDFVDKTISQYSQLVVKYMISKGSLTTQDSVLFYVENETFSENATLNQVNSWSYTFVDIGSFTISIEYEGKKQKLGTITVEKYSDENIPSIDTSIVELYLTAMGKSNTQTNKDVWEWDNYGTVYSANFENFLWGTENGWLEDPSGAPALKLTNGAKLSIPNYYTFSKDAVSTGLTIELDFMFSNVMDYNAPLITCLSETLKADGSLDSYKVGININGQKSTLNSDKYKATTVAIGGEEAADGSISATDMALQALTQYFNEDTRIHLTYVIQRLSGSDFRFIYTYVNGVLSGIMKMDSDEKFIQNSGSPAIFKFDSTYADIYLYGIRTYRQALDPNVVIDNYIADISDIDEKIRLAKNNAVFNLNNKVSKGVIDAMGMALGVPYVVFEGGIEMPKKFKVKDLGDIGHTFDSKTYALPVRKDDFRLMSMKMYSKAEDGSITTEMDIPIELGEDKEFKTKVTSFDDIKTGKPYWFNRGVQVYGQGTSSMVYPVKNLRLKFISKGDYPSVKNSPPLEIICFKADFMDSSSSHNTPTGNLVDELYEALKMQTPPQRFNSSSEEKIYTAIKGFPIICFFKDYADEDTEDEYIYIGRYNFNIDKATPEPFGFYPMSRKTGETVVDENGVTREVVEVCGLRTEIVDGKTVLPLDEDGKEIEDDIIQCWEWLNNDTNSPTKFLTPEKSDGSRYSSYDEALQNAWFDYYEDRYPDEIVGIWEDYEKGEASEDDKAWSDEALENGLFRMTRWVNSTAIDSKEISNKTFDEPIYLKTLDKSYDPEIIYYDSNHNAVEVRLVEYVNYSTSTIEEGDSFDPLSVSINESTFKSKVSNVRGTYSFSYTGSAWTLFENNTTVEVQLSDYGITVSETPNAGWGIVVDYGDTYQGWNSSLLEKHTTDNARYRLAKFKSEFTQYFDLDYCLFYYIVTLILLMMDSRAKNMMMASWDQTIWYPIFYDMDTMLGLNNTGFNKFSYDTEDDPEDKVFNGYDSVLWNNFRECFYTEIADFYNQIRTPLNLNKLLSTYNEGSADMWNEALTTQDAIYKYERPYKEGYYDGKEGEQIGPGEINYLYAAQGRRSNHRAWWLKNRLNYLDSKYKPENLGNQKPTQSEAFSFRAYALPAQQSSTAAQACIKDHPANHQFDITALANSYQSLFIGNIVYGPTYTRANETITIGPAFPKHEVESYILNPSLIADLGDLSDKYIGSWQMPSNRLTSLKFGRSSRSHPDNNYETYYNSLLTSLNIGENTPYLTYLNIARCTGLPTLDLSKCNKLQILDAEGANGLTGITFPRDSILEELYIPTSIKSLEIHNQPYLKVVQFDEDGEPTLTSLILENVGAFDSYQVANKTFANPNNDIPFVLTNINWRIDDFEDGATVTRIPILEKLLEEDTKITPAEGYDLATGLTGKITLGGNINVDEYTIYSRYKPYFPDLEIVYDKESGVNLTEAYVITFLNDIDSTKIHYQVKTNGQLTLEQLVTDNPLNPNGSALTKPEKESTLSVDFIFSGYWQTADNNNWYYSDSLFTPADAETNVAITTVKFSDIKPDKNMTFYPYYGFSQKVYQVRFYDDQGNLIKLPMSSGGTTEEPTDEAYLSYYQKPYEGSMKNFYYKDDSTLADDKRYAFLGWGTTRNAVRPTYIDLDTLIVESNMNLYAYFQ